MFTNKWIASLGVVCAFQVMAQTPPNSTMTQGQPYPPPTYQTPPPGAPGNPIPTPMPAQNAVLAPAPVVVAPEGVVVPPGVVYVAPTYPAPAVGYVWTFAAGYGWGWYHPRFGWHRRWR